MLPSLSFEGKSTSSQSPGGGGSTGENAPEEKAGGGRLVGAGTSLGVSFCGGASGSHPMSASQGSLGSCPERLTPQKEQLRLHVSHKNNKDQREQKA